MLSDDFCGTHAVTSHTLDWLQSQGQQIDCACCIYATAPLLRVDNLKAGYQKLINDNLSMVYSVTTFPFPIQRAVYLNDEIFNTPIPFDIKGYKQRSQDLRVLYHDAGQFYWGIPNAFRESYDLFSNTTGTVCLPRNEVCDIDEMVDWKIAESLYVNFSDTP